MVHVAPGASGEMGWQFTKRGEFRYGGPSPGTRRPECSAASLSNEISLTNGRSKMKTRSIAALAATAAFLALPTLAAHVPHHAGESPAASTSAGYTDGEVRRVDKAAGKITLKHGAIANLEMPPMSMVFRAKDRAMLDQVKEGDKVRFKADNIDGALTLTDLQPAH